MAENALTEGRSKELQSIEAASAVSVLEFESPSGVLMHVQPVGSARSVSWVLSIMVVALLVVAALFPIDMDVVATGRVISTADTIMIQPYDPSIIRSVNVHEGQVVHKGDVLARLDPTFAGSDEAQLQGDVDNYQAQVDEMQAEINHVPYQPKVANNATAVQAAYYGERMSQYRSTVTGYDMKIAGLQSTLGQAQADIQGYTARLQLAVQLENIRQQLEKMQVGSVIDRLSAQDQRTEISRELADAIATSQNATANIKEMSQEKETFIQNWFATVSSSLTEAQRNLSDNLQSLNKARLRRQIVDMKSPIDAVVLSISPTSTGAVLQPSSPLMQLTPLDAPMELDTLVAGQDAGWVHPGQPALIKFTTYNYTRYGTATGTVRYQSADSFTQITNSTQTGVTMQQQGSPTMPFYDARITIDSNNMHGVPGGFHLRPGMPVTAEVQVGKRTILEYMLQRVLPVAYEGMREPP